MCSRMEKNMCYRIMTKHSKRPGLSRVFFYLPVEDIFCYSSILARAASFAASKVVTLTGPYV